MRRLMALIAVAALAFAACSDDDGGTEAGRRLLDHDHARVDDHHRATPRPVSGVRCGDRGPGEGAARRRARWRRAVVAAVGARPRGRRRPDAARRRLPRPGRRGRHRDGDVEVRRARAARRASPPSSRTAPANRSGGRPRLATPRTLTWSSSARCSRGSSEELCIDESRVYAAGLSMGGFMSSLVACEMSGRFAAVAPVAGLQFPEGCNPGRPDPRAVVPRHGRSDPAVQRRREHRRAAAGARRRTGPTTTSTSVPTDTRRRGLPGGGAGLGRAERLRGLDRRGRERQR